MNLSKLRFIISPWPSSSSSSSSAAAADAAATPAKLLVAAPLLLLVLLWLTIPQLYLQIIPPRQEAQITISPSNYRITPSHASAASSGNDQRAPTSASSSCSCSSSSSSSSAHADDHRPQQEIQHPDAVTILDQLDDIPGGGDATVRLDIGGSSSSSSSSSSEEDGCRGRYVYMHTRLPARFNEEMITRCRELSPDWMDICSTTSNEGLGPRLEELESYDDGDDGEDGDDDGDGDGDGRGGDEVVEVERDTKTGKHHNKLADDQGSLSSSSGGGISSSNSSNSSRHGGGGGGGDDGDDGDDDDDDGDGEKKKKKRRRPRGAGSRWYKTDHLGLDVVFHARMKRYACLTGDAGKADAVYVPFYAGVDSNMKLFDGDVRERDGRARELEAWLTEQPEWARSGGRDHFVVTGKIGWDFRRMPNDRGSWGTALLNLPGLAGRMAVIGVETSGMDGGGVGVEAAIPYPTYFHPRTDGDLRRRQRRAAAARRPHLFAFAGAARPEMPSSIRGLLLEQCRAAGPATCRLLQLPRGSASSSAASRPSALLDAFSASAFCLQPPGDSFTRRSLFDAALCGCVPVLFHPRSAYTQYLWHLPPPGHPDSYSVFIPEEAIRNGSASVAAVLRAVPAARVRALRAALLRLLPSLVYAHPDARLRAFRDAFDVALDGIVAKVRANVASAANAANAANVASAANAAAAARQPPPTPPPPPL